MIGEKTIFELQDEYLLVEPKLNRLKDVILEQLSFLMNQNGIKLGFPIQARVKTFKSVADKLENRFKIKNSVLELQDLLGLRIILLFKRDVEEVCSLLDKNLKIINKYDSLERLKDNQFGYSSQHYVVEIPEGWLNVPTISGLQEIKIEIQIRTMSQHTWAEASQLLHYKQEGSAPKQLSRSIGRVSALLETVDLEFERLLQERQIYKEDIKEDVHTDEFLNVDIVEAVISSRLPIKNRGKNEDFESIFLNLLDYSIDSKRKLDSLIDSYLNAALEEDKRILTEIASYKTEIDRGEIDSNKIRYITSKSRQKLGVFFSFQGLLVHMLEQAFPERTKELEAKRQKRVLDINDLDLLS